MHVAWRVAASTAGKAGIAGRAVEPGTTCSHSDGGSSHPAHERLLWHVTVFPTPIGAPRSCGAPSSLPHPLTAGEDTPSPGWRFP